MTPGILCVDNGLGYFDRVVELIND